MHILLLETMIERSQKFPFGGGGDDCWVYKKGNCSSCVWPVAIPCIVVPPQFTWYAGLLIQQKWESRLLGTAHLSSKFEQSISVPSQSGSLWWQSGLCWWHPQPQSSYEEHERVCVLKCSGIHLSSNQSTEATIWELTRPRSDVTICNGMFSNHSNFF